MGIRLTSCRMDDANNPGRAQQCGAVAIQPAFTGTERSGGHDNPWADYELVHCADGKARRTGKCIQRVADGISEELGQYRAERQVCEEWEMIHPLCVGERNRAHKLRAYGNAIVPQVAAAFIEAFMESEQG